MAYTYSILVPTRQRPDTLLATLATLIWHPGDDYEIVVADNCGDDQVAAVINAVQQRHPRVKHLRCDEVLPMAQNWERGLAACSGDYVSVLGDDDAFLPTTLQLVRAILDATDARVIAWNTHTYWWPDTIVPWNKNRLYVSLGNNNVIWAESRPALVNTYRDTVAFGQLPMIYNGFVHREVINAVIDRFGAYFVPAEQAPDVTSGILNLAFTNRFLYSNRPLAVRGNSRHSYGTAGWARSRGKERVKTYLKEEGQTWERLIHPSLVTSQNIGFGIASLKLHMKDLLFPHDKEIQIDRGAIVKFVLATLNNDPDVYDENLAEALQLAEKIGMKVAPADIPAKAATTTLGGLQGPSVSGSNVTLGINCDIANIFDVCGAARLAEALASEPAVQVIRPASVAVPERMAG